MRGAAALVASIWARVALQAVRRQLRRRRQLTEIRVPRPPRRGGRGAPVVLRVLDELGASCLERALVLQAWHTAHGRAADVVIGVRSRGGALDAHAWLSDPAGPGTLEGYERLIAVRTPGRDGR